MNRREFLKTLSATTALVGLSPFSCNGFKKQLPNIVLVYADDLG